MRGSGVSLWLILTALTPGCFLAYEPTRYQYRDDAGLDASLDAALDASSSDSSVPCSGQAIRCFGTCVDPTSSAQHCGTCGNACPTPANADATCNSGSCGFQCQSMFEDCDNDHANGCEVQLNNDAENCGACGNACDTALYCRSAQCRPSPVGWRAFGGSGTDEATAAAVDSDGNIYITGSFQGTVNLGGVDLDSAGSSPDVFVASYSSTGTHRWSRAAGTNGVGSAITVDPSGNVYVTGYFFGSANFGGAALASGAGTAAFVASFDSNGIHRWSLAGVSSDTAWGKAIATDTDGNVYLTGSIYGTANFGGTDLVSSGTDIFVASYTSGGAHRWSRSDGGPDSTGDAISVDNAGNVYVAGHYTGTAHFGTTLVSAGGSDAFVQRLTDAGSPRWTRSAGGTGEDVANGVATDSRGNIYLVGAFSGSASFGSQELMSAGRKDCFVASYLAAGTTRWAVRAGDSADDQGNAIAVTSADEIYVTGSFNGTADFGGGPIDSGGGSDAFMARYDTDGGHSASFGAGGTGDDVGLGLGARADVVCISGRYDGTIQLGSDSFSSAGGISDAFVLCVAP